jgi:hypothetical protein
MRTSVPFALALALLTTTLSAQDPSPRIKQDPKPAAVKATPVPKTTPDAKPKADQAKKPGDTAAAPEDGNTPKKKSLLQRVFGKKDRATPAPTTPVPTPPPTAKPRSRPRSTTTATDSAKKPADSTTEAPEKKEDEPAPATPTKKTRGKKGAAKPDETTESTPEAEKTKEQIAVDKAVESGDQDAIEKAKYDEVRSRALADEKVKALKEKADSATGEEEGRQALRAYNKALFQKMRSLDSSIKDRVDRMETAVLKRLEGNQ